MTPTRRTPPDGEPGRPASPPGDRTTHAAIWLPGLAVAFGAAVATAHGLFEVAVAARVPAGIAWLYPLITDGLALVAYAATARLRDDAVHYAWSVVILAAGLSGLAQASYLAGGATLDASPALRFGVGAWPAVAAAVVAHLLYLLAESDPREPTDRVAAVTPSPTAIPATVRTQPVPTSDAALSGRLLEGPDIPAALDTSHTRPSDTSPPVPLEEPVSSGPAAVPDAARDRGQDSPVRDRARAAAMRHATHHGALPTVRQLMDLADVSRGTAADALKALRQQSPPLRIVPTNPEQRTRP